MNGLRILIVDDEAPARWKIRNFLKDEAGAVILEAEDGRAALKSIQGKKIDLVFLDIQMPGMDGFELIEAVGVEGMPAVVFVTAYDHYALRAFEVRAVDYLLKPFDRERFRRALERARERVGARAVNSAALGSILREVRKDRGFMERLAVRKGPSIFFVRVADIRHIAAEEKYVNLYTSEGVWLVREPIGRLEERLDPALFARIHKSHIVNREFVKEVQPWSHGDSIVILKNGDQVPLSRRFRANLLDAGRLKL